MTKLPETDPLRALLIEAAPVAAPARDLAFTLDVMKRVEQRRLAEGLLALSSVVLVASAILFVIMPYITPALTSLGTALVPLVAIVAVLGASFVAFDQMRRYLRFRF